MRTRVVVHHHRVIRLTHYRQLKGEKGDPAPITPFKYWASTQLGQNYRSSLLKIDRVILGNRPSRLLHTTTKVLRRVNDIMAQKEFGLLFDIDGVLLRGKEPIDVAAEAMQMIYKVCSFFYVLKFSTFS